MNESISRGVTSLGCTAWIRGTPRIMMPDTYVHRSWQDTDLQVLLDLSYTSSNRYMRLYYLVNATVSICQVSWLCATFRDQLFAVGMRCRLAPKKTPLGGHIQAICR